MNLLTAYDGMTKGLTETLFGMQHLVFCLLLGLILFTQRRKPREAWLYILALIPGLILERLQPFSPVLVNVVVALSVTVVLLVQWMYEKMAAYVPGLLLFGGFFHGLSLAHVVAGSSVPAFIAYSVSATLVQILVILVFGRFCQRVSLRSPDGFEGLENILSAVGAGVALAYLVLAF